MLILRFCARTFSSCGERGPLFIAVRGPLTIAASLVAEHRLQTRSLSSCGARASLLRGMWDLPRPGLEPVSPAWAGRLSTTAPQGKPALCSLLSFASIGCGRARGRAERRFYNEPIKLPTAFVSCTKNLRVAVCPVSLASGSECREGSPLFSCRRSEV